MIDMRFCAFLGLLLLIAGCNGNTFDVSDGKSRLVEAKYRSIVSVRRAVIGVEGQPVLDDRGDPVLSVSVCAEPSPDALQSTARALEGKVSANDLNALLSYMRSETQDYVGLRTQTIQLLRDAYFRLCEAFMNDGIDAIAYDVLQRRFQSQIVALLAVEQLTGAAIAGRSATREYPATQLARIADALEQSEEKLRNLLQERDKAKKYLSGLEDKEAAEKDKKVHEVAIEAARKALEALQEQVEQRKRATSLLKDSFAMTARAARSHNAAEPAGTAIPAAGQATASGVADAVRAITLNAINQDYESQVCFETLRYHNHLSQFRNDVNKAFDSGGFQTNLADSTFLDHCANLFASQADFRNARVSAAEAFADAIRAVTKKIGTDNFSASEAASYIRALAESVPTVPGAAFLPHDPKNSSERQWPLGVKVNIDGKFNASASMEGHSAASGGDNDRK